LLDNPKEYKIGLENIFFNSWVFWRWFFYGLWQGTLLVILTFYTMNSSVTNSGTAIGCLETDGQFVFSAIVIVVNLKVLVSSYEFTVLSILTALFGIVSYFIILGFFGFSDIYTMQGDFQHLFLTGP
jgi:magnesium-transporting ATPase (P-type)